MSDAQTEVPSVLIDTRRLRRRVRALGAEITRDYRDRNPLFVGVLRGAAVFLSDLIRHVDLKIEVDFIAMSSYGSATESTGQVQLLKDLESSIAGVDVILVEDIVDTGLTLNYLIGNLQSRNPASLRVCALLSKPSRRRLQVTIDYLGFEVPDRFVVGYGLDYNQQFRNLTYIGMLEAD
ncbi:MAG TPA: hypoxanthine phosphoribosyltransferase [Acidobacteriota bacterium]|nr:hypoxanthine phosphoribosyltransferase [Acidobacteriota bacterium]